MRFLYLYYVNKVELEILNVIQGLTQHHSYAVVLGEVNSERRLPIVIGAAEAHAIAVAIENMTSTRPLTHDLFKNVMDTFHIHLSEVVITNLMDGIFYSKLVCIANGEEHEIDSRTSDALALAIRYKCPIYIYDNILEMSDISAKTEDVQEFQKIETEKPSKPNDYSIYTQKELEKLLNDALAEESYEKAAAIRDELNKRDK